MIRADYVNYGACRLFSLWILQQDDEGCLFVKSHQLKIDLCIYIYIYIYIYCFISFNWSPASITAGISWRKGKWRPKCPSICFPVAERVLRNTLRNGNSTSGWKPCRRVHTWTKHDEDAEFMQMKSMIHSSLAHAIGPFRNS